MKVHLFKLTQICKVMLIHYRRHMMHLKRCYLQERGQKEGGGDREKEVGEQWQGEKKRSLCGRKSK